MTTFAVTSTDQTLDAVNYLLSNLNQTGNVGNATIPTGTLIGNTTTGIVSTYNYGSGDAYSYLYQYINLRYANNATGTSGFSTVPTNAQYFGVYNSVTSVASSVPAAYTYYQVSGGFGTTKSIYYSTQGGRQIQLIPANVAPSANFIQSTANVAIDLDVVTTAAGTPGSRGPIAMAYVVTPSTPVGASDLQLTAWWEAARDSLTPPIGTGLTPVTGDTGTFIYGAGVGTPSETYEFNGSGWNEVVPQVISGNVIVANSMPGTAITASSITGNRIAANTITGNTIQVNTITGNLITANTITGNTIQASTITGNLIAASTITGNLITASTITGNLIAASTITGNLVAANTITATNIATNTITANQIAANTITATQISTAYLYAGNIISTNGQIGNTSSPGYWLQYNTGDARFGGNVSIGANAQIGGNLFVTGLITSGALNSNTVDSTQLVPNAVVSSKIADNAITTSKIIADAVTTTQIANQAVSNAKIALATITGSLVQAQTLTGNLIATSTITGNLIAGSTITGSLIAGSTITGNLIALNTITGNLVATGTITATNIAASTITASQIAASTITAGQIAAGTITATQIAAGTITATNIATNTITAGQIAAGTITSTQIAANTVVANNIAANTITATQISSAYVYAGNIISTNGDLGNTASPGYWLRYTDGDARFGGNVSIGANLTVGNLISASNLNANTVAFTNLVAGTVPAPASGNTTSNANISLTTSGDYDWTYTGGVNRGYWKTLARIDIPVTTPLSLATASVPQYYNVTFSANVVGSGLQGGSTGPGFYIFTNFEATPAASTYGGSGIPILVFNNSSPDYPGSDDTPGSLVSPQFGRNLTTGSYPQAYTGVFQLSGSTQIPYSTGQAVLGSTLTIGCGVFNDRNTTPSGNVGSLVFSSIAFSVIPGSS